MNSQLPPAPDNDSGDDSEHYLNFADAIVNGNPPDPVDFAVVRAVDRAVLATLAAGQTARQPYSGVHPRYGNMVCLPGSSVPVTPPEHRMAQGIRAALRLLIEVIRTIMQIVPQQQWGLAIAYALSEIGWTIEPNQRRFAQQEHGDWGNKLMNLVDATARYKCPTKKYRWRWLILMDTTPAERALSRLTSSYATTAGTNQELAGISTASAQKVGNSNCIRACNRWAKPVVKHIQEHSDELKAESELLSKVITTRGNYDKLKHAVDKHGEIQDQQIQARQELKDSLEELRESGDQLLDNINKDIQALRDHEKLTTLSSRLNQILLAKDDDNLSNMGAPPPPPPADDPDDPPRPSTGFRPSSSRGIPDTSTNPNTSTSESDTRGGYAQTSNQFSTQNQRHQSGIQDRANLVQQQSSSPTSIRLKNFRHCIRLLCHRPLLRHGPANFDTFHAAVNSRFVRGSQVPEFDEDQAKDDLEQIANARDLVEYANGNVMSILPRACQDDTCSCYSPTARQQYKLPRQVNVMPPPPPPPSSNTWIGPPRRPPPHGPSVFGIDIVTPKRTIPSPDLATMMGTPPKQPLHSDSLFSAPVPPTVFRDTLRRIKLEGDLDLVKAEVEKYHLKKVIEEGGEAEGYYNTLMDPDQVELEVLEQALKSFKNLMYSMDREVAKELAAAEAEVEADKAMKDGGDETQDSQMGSM